MQSFNRRQWLVLTGAASVAALAGCGFRLRGAGNGLQQYPFRSLYIAGTATAPAPSLIAFRRVGVVYSLMFPPCVESLWSAFRRMRLLSIANERGP